MKVTNRLLRQQSSRVTTDQSGPDQKRIAQRAYVPDDITTRSRPMRLLSAKRPIMGTPDHDWLMEQIERRIGKGHLAGYVPATQETHCNSTRICTGRRGPIGDNRESSRFCPQAHHRAVPPAQRIGTLHVPEDSPLSSLFKRCGLAVWTHDLGAARVRPWLAGLKEDQRERSNRRLEGAKGMRSTTAFQDDVCRLAVSWISVTRHHSG